MQDMNRLGFEPRTAPNMSRSTTELPDLLYLTSRSLTYSYRIILWIYYQCLLWNKASLHLQLWPMTKAEAGMDNIYQAWLFCPPQSPWFKSLFPLWNCNLYTLNTINTLPGKLYGKTLMDQWLSTSTKLLSCKQQLMRKLTSCVIQNLCSLHGWDELWFNCDKQISLIFKEIISMIISSCFG